MGEEVSKTYVGFACKARVRAEVGHGDEPALAIVERQGLAIQLVEEIRNALARPVACSRLPYYSPLGVPHVSGGLGG